eukprot:Em0018g535a
MDSIYHEKQEGFLCAQHCLNNLLQGSLFTAVDLAQFGHQLDEQELATMVEGAGTADDLRRLHEKPSSNMDDTGYFSIQVINRALQVWNLELVPTTSPSMKHVLDNPVQQSAFICNHEQHWFTIRKLGRQWFNLDSLLKKPKLVSDTYLSLFLTQLQMEGYSIFVVRGELPSSEADQLLQVITLDATGHEATANRGNSVTSSTSSSSSTEHQSSVDESFDLELATAISASLAESQTSVEETRQRRVEYFARHHKPESS